MSLPSASSCLPVSEGLPPIKSLPPATPPPDLNSDSGDMFPLPLTSPSGPPNTMNTSPTASLPIVPPSSSHGNRPDSDDMMPLGQPIRASNFSNPEDMPPAREPSVQPGSPRNPWQFGEIEGFPVGSRWPDRETLSLDGVHAPPRAGIHGRQKEGCYSIVLSGGYPDDVDMGEELTYTGEGGRQPFEKGVKWNNVQIQDQEWTRGNEALRISWRRGTPVRVIRGHTLPSEWAPTEGYRYDGLYEVMKCSMEKSKFSDFQVCRFLLRRLPNQPPLPSRNQAVRYPMRPDVSQRAWSSECHRPTPPTPHQEAGPSSKLLPIHTKDVEEFDGKGKEREVEFEPLTPMVPSVTVKSEFEGLPDEDQDMDDFYCSEAEEKKWKELWEKRQQSAWSMDDEF